MPIDPAARTVELARLNIGRGGKPFSCLVLYRGELVAESPNLVVQTNDPTAHAEVVAIRQACQRLGAPSLEGCEVWALAHPCPMCLGALYYAAPDSFTYLVTREEEGRFYRDDGRYVEMESFYAEFGLAPEDRRLPMRHAPHEEGVAVYRQWRERQGPD